jgi:AtzE family amidohydrolase
MSAVDTVSATFARIEASQARLNAFTDTVRERALAHAASVKPGSPLAGVPFSVKNLFDIRGLTTLAGSKINRDNAPAEKDSPLISALEQAGAVLVGANGMGEYAYDFTGRNAHYGPTRNPHDPERMSGGSSGGSAVAVAAGLVPLSLGSDTNGSIRVPASFCGIYGLKPTYGRLSRTNSFPFVDALDHLGPLARDVPLLAAAYDAMQGADDTDPVLAHRPIERSLPDLHQGPGALRVARLGGHFEAGLVGDAAQAVDRVAAALQARETVELADAGCARAAAFVITASEAGALHRRRLIDRAADFDPETRDRLLAGALAPAAWLDSAQRFRRRFQRTARDLFQNYDVLIAAATPCTAPLVDQKSMMFNGQEVPVRANLGVYTQPISFIGLPVVAVPLKLSAMPIGVQLIGRPWSEALLLRVAAFLERVGVTEASIAGN